MQRLTFHPSWDKGLSDDDREWINHIFQETRISNQCNIEFTPLWDALNHKGDLLVTVLVHNTGEKNFFFDNHDLIYSVNNQTMAEHCFMLPNFIIEPTTSMPWTFIFPYGTFTTENQSLKDGVLTME
ncbi:SLAP domain-containing protein [Virgibacillus sp. JSM 102003]|uniref:SLAP domain-containing protein n=1 Tax=Virgibacillus sp. JSM 102003 TaxID=1562108 RepID=UPI0035C08E38